MHHTHAYTHACSPMSPPCISLKWQKSSLDFFFLPVETPKHSYRLFFFKDIWVFVLSKRCFFPGKNKKQSQYLRVKLSALKEFPPEGMLSYVLGFFFFLLVFESASKIHENKQQQPPPKKSILISQHCLRPSSRHGCLGFLMFWMAWGLAWVFSEKYNFKLYAASWCQNSVHRQPYDVHGAQH